MPLIGVFFLIYMPVFLHLVYNFQGLRLPMPSSLRMPVWRSYLWEYDYAVCDFWNLASQLVLLVLVHFRTTFNFTITRALLNFLALLIFTCHRRLGKSSYWSVCLQRVLLQSLL